MGTLLAPWVRTIRRSLYPLTHQQGFYVGVRRSGVSVPTGSQHHEARHDVVKVRPNPRRRRGYSRL